MVAISLEYPPALGLPCDVVSFALWPGYGCKSSAEAHEWILWLLRGPQPAEILDETGSTWMFYRETVRSVVTW